MCKRMIRSQKEAEARYVRRRRQIDLLVSEIQKELAAHDELLGTEQICWGRTGTMEHVAEQMAQALASFRSGEIDDLTPAERGIKG